MDDNGSRRLSRRNRRHVSSPISLPLPCRQAHITEISMVGTQAESIPAHHTLRKELEPELHKSRLQPSVILPPAMPYLDRGIQGVESSSRVEPSRELRSCWHWHWHWRGSRSWKIPSGTVKEAASVREITLCPWLFVEPVTRHPSAVISTGSLQAKIGPINYAPSAQEQFQQRQKHQKTHNPVCELKRRTTSLARLSELVPRSIAFTEKDILRRFCPTEPESHCTQPESVAYEAITHDAKRKVGAAAAVVSYLGPSGGVVWSNAGPAQGKLSRAAVLL
ncbi:uncharacterized protein CLUP02_13796 [Colletotrichum lupini]|uniref:Uncharacterized protein n=1 Tax=Colletotrichum lupini TaxID=145971 RepID=A0A9Q8T344_9PEZI|nr:uncharacterized protein CLUP02_13796 [Colletotrichum lupini]UQC88273.1 hypothetical protein CLUP02_13796 [Colletotrichum lupini]